MSINHKNKVNRNELCPCQSGLKHKNCHGDQVKMMQCKVAANERMIELIQEEKIRRGIIVIDEDAVKVDDGAVKEAYDQATEKVCKK